MKLFSQDTKVEALRHATLFEGLSRKQLVQLARVSEDLEVPAGKVLCKEGEVGQEFFVIIDGEVEVTKNGKRVATRAAGEFFGEIALLRKALQSCESANAGPGKTERTRRDGVEAPR